jgi:hypothetical protein
MYRKDFNGRMFNAELKRDYYQSVMASDIEIAIIR